MKAGQLLSEIVTLSTSGAAEAEERKLRQNKLGVERLKAACLKKMRECAKEGSWGVTVYYDELKHRVPSTATVQVASWLEQQGFWVKHDINGLVIKWGEDAGVIV